MKTIIITRDGEYADSLAYQMLCSKDVVRTNKKGHFNAYIHGLFKKYLINDALEEYAKIRGESSLPSEDIIGELLADDDEHIGIKIYEENIKEKLDNILYDSKPYATFAMDNENEVTFVFVNEIFGKFLSSSDLYPLFVKREDRKEFIKAICADCDIIETEKREDNNTLYIHDKEWGSSKEEHIFIKGECFDANGKDALDAYGGYFSNLIVFQHIKHGGIFNRIGMLTFENTEVAEEIRIKRKGKF